MTEQLTLDLRPDDHPDANVTVAKDSDDLPVIALAAQLERNEHDAAQHAPTARTCQCDRPWPDRDDCVKCGRIMDR